MPVARAWRWTGPAAHGAALTVSHEAIAVHWCKAAQQNLPMPAYYCQRCGLDRAEIVAQHEATQRQQKVIVDEVVDRMNALDGVKEYDL